MMPKSQNHLAELLNISKGAVSRLAARGMPTHSLGAAQAWRATHLDPARTKGNRLDAHYQRRSPAQPVQRAPEVNHLAHAAALLDVASVALANGGGIDALVPTLRAALAAVPLVSVTACRCR